MDSYQKIIKDTESLLKYHKNLGIDKYQVDENLKEFLEVTSSKALSKAAIAQQRLKQKSRVTASAGAAAQKVETLKDIRLELGDCTRCSLHENRTAIIFGSGEEKAELLIVSEWPNRSDDLNGALFSGPEGEMLDKMLQNVLKLNREEIYLSSIVKCRVPENSAPSQLQINSCKPFMASQIASINPRVICTMGPLSSQALLRTNKPLLRLRGHVHDYNGIPLIPTFHPAYLMKNPEMKKATFIDLQMIRKKLDSL